MGRNRKVECRICLKTMTSDHLERHMKTHEKKSNGKDDAGSSGRGVCEKVGKHKQVECKICLKTMTSNNLKKHMKTHEKKNKWMRYGYRQNRIQLMIVLWKTKTC